MLYKCKYIFLKCYAKITPFFIHLLIFVPTFAYEQTRKPINTNKNMKKILLTLSAVLALVTFVACETPKDEPPVNENPGTENPVDTVPDVDDVPLFTINVHEDKLSAYSVEFDIIPSDNPIHVIAGRDVLLESIERASLLAREGKNNLIKMTIRNNLLTITSRSEEGNVKEEIVVEKTGDDLEIGFNSKFVIDVLKAIDDEEISMYFKTGTSPCVVSPVEGDAYEYLILPVRIPTM